jgi:hypothetical protein
MRMVEEVEASTGGEGCAVAAQLLHDVNVEYGEPTPPAEELASRLAELIAEGHVTVLIARPTGAGAAVGAAVMRLQPSVWSRAHEAYLAELHVAPSQRGTATVGS